MWRGSTVVIIEVRKYVQTEQSCGITTIEAKEVLDGSILRCHLQPVTGPCKAYFRRYYCHVNSKLFVYGGCGGNKNNFETEEACLRECAHEYLDCK